MDELEDHLRNLHGFRVRVLRPSRSGIQRLVVHATLDTILKWHRDRLAYTIRRLHGYLADDLALQRYRKLDQAIDKIREQAGAPPEEQKSPEENRKDIQKKLDDAKLEWVQLLDSGFQDHLVGNGVSRYKRQFWEDLDESVRHGLFNFAERNVLRFNRFNIERKMDTTKKGKPKVLYNIEYPLENGKISYISDYRRN